MIRQRKPLERKTPLRRSAPPKRKTRLKQKRATPRRVSVSRDDAYKAAVRKLACVGTPDGNHDRECRSWMRRQASHLGRDGGGSMKAGDTSCVPQSSSCHRAWGESGRFPKALKREWADRTISAVHADLERRGLYRFPAEAGESSYPTTEVAPVKLSRGGPSPAAASDVSGEAGVPW